MYTCKCVYLINIKLGIIHIRVCHTYIILRYLQLRESKNKFANWEFFKEQNFYVFAIVCS